MPGQINYLRISITDRCNLRCFYCTPWDGWEKLPAPEILRYEELLRLAGVAAGARSGVGVDISRRAAATTRDNARANGLDKLPERSTK